MGPPYVQRHPHTETADVGLWYSLVDSGRGGSQVLEMTIERVSFRTPSFQNNLRVVVLKQKGGTRCLPTWVSPAEANDILP